jgi:hypothetical protein
MRFTANANGNEVVSVYTPEAFYICQTSDTCFYYPISEAASLGFDPSNFVYSNDEVAGYENNALYQGEQACPAGTCHVWQVGDGSTTSTLLIDTVTKRISQVQSSSSTGDTSLVYEYKDVSITPPANAMPVPSL